MRLGLSVLFFLAGGILLAQGQDKLVATFDGPTAQTTGPFTVTDKWELRWTGASSLTITARNADGTVAFGTAATADGSLYEPKGGTFYLQLAGAPSASAPAWHVSVVEVGPSPTASSLAVYVPPETGSPPPAVAQCRSRRLP